MTTTFLYLSLLATTTLWGICRISYNIFLHPLRKFPGPWMAGATSGWKAYKEVIKKETLARELFALHEKYGTMCKWMERAIETSTHMPHR